MCRRNQILGGLLASFGVGLFVACFFESGFICGCLGLGIAIGGVALCRKK